MAIFSDNSMLISSNTDFLQRIIGAEPMVGVEVAGFRGVCTAEEKGAHGPSQ